MTVCFVCFNFIDSNLRKQPWRYVYELALAYEDEAIVLTDADGGGIDDLEIRTVEKVWAPTGPSRQLLDSINRIGPDAVVSLIGATTCLRPRNLATELDCPTIGLFAGPVYDLADIAAVGAREFVRNFEYIDVHLVGSLTPEFAIRRALTAYDAVAVQTDSTRERLCSIAPDATIQTIRTGISEEDLRIPAEESAPVPCLDSDEQSVLYFTSPLTLRGTDTLVRAMANLDESNRCKLVILSRQDDGGLSYEERHLTELATKLGIQDQFQLVAKNLTPNGIRQCLSAATVVSLPYKLVLSNVPISVLETMAVGTPVVTTAVDGLPEIVDEPKQLVPPTEPIALSRALASILTSRELQEELSSHNRTRMSGYDRWDDSRARLVQLVEDSLHG